jgi:hypothetical protein
VGDNFPIDSKTLLVTDFVNLKIKPSQSFENVHKSTMRIHTFIVVNTRVSVFIKKLFLNQLITCVAQFKIIEGRENRSPPVVTPRTN